MLSEKHFTRIIDLANLMFFVINTISYFLFGKYAALVFILSLPTIFIFYNVFSNNSLKKWVIKYNNKYKGKIIKKVVYDYNFVSFKNSIEHYKSKDKISNLPYEDCIFFEFPRKGYKATHLSLKINDFIYFKKAYIVFSFNETVINYKQVIDELNIENSILFHFNCKKSNDEISDNSRIKYEKYMSNLVYQNVIYLNKNEVIYKNLFELPLNSKYIYQYDIRNGGLYGKDIEKKVEDKSVSTVTAPIFGVDSLLNKIQKSNN